MRRITGRVLLLAGGLVVVAAGQAQAQTIVVTKFEDPAPTFCLSGLDCSFREAMATANSLAGPDTIQLAAGTYTLTLDQLPTITTDTTVQGQGAAATTITGADTAAAASPAGGVFAVSGGTAKLTLRGVTISGNRLTGTAAIGGGAIAFDAGATVAIESSALRANRSEASSTGAGGGAIASDGGGTLTITDSAIEDNVYAGTNTVTGGGGVATSSTGTITISRSSISRNRADLVGAGNLQVAGGLLVNVATSLSIADSTVHGNTISSGGATVRVAGIATSAVPTVTLTHVTVTDNVTSGTGTLVGGNLVFLAGVKTLRNSIVAGGLPSNCSTSGSAIVSEGGNLEDASSCGFTGPGDLVNTDPQLGALRANGGIGRTQAPLPTSPVFGLAQSAFCSSTDQRGVARPVGGACDSGAFEGAPPPASIALPAITGTPAVGQILSCGPGTFSGAPTLAFAWLRDGAAVPGATTAAYTVAAADLGTALQCQVTATNTSGTAVATSPAVVPPLPAAPPPPPPAPAAPANSARPTFGGTLRTGLKTTCTAGTWTGATGFAFAWLRNGTTVPGAAAAAYTLTATDAGKALQCRVTATGAGGSTVAESAPAVPAKACIVPTLVGTTLATARKWLTIANCALGKVTAKTSAKKPGLVLASAPVKGKNLAAGAKVALTISKR